MYVGIVRYKEDEFGGLFRIGHQPTSNLERLKKWKTQTEALEHVIECHIYQIYEE